MPGRSPSEAVSNFLEPLQRAASCVTRTPFVVSSGGRHELGKIHTLTWAGAEPVPVLGPRGEVVTLDLAIAYEILHIPEDRERGPYKVSTRGYMHAVQTIDGGEVIAFHWHPSSIVRDTHMHVGSTQLISDGVLSKKHHIPAPRMSVEGVLRFASTSSASNLCGTTGRRCSRTARTSSTCGRLGVGTSRRSRSERPAGS